MTTWKDGGDYGRYSREITDEEGRRVICHVRTRQSGYGHGDEPWPEGKANFRLILQAPRTARALRTIAEGAIVSPGQLPEKIAEQVLGVLRTARESAAEYMMYAGKQQQRAERAEAALEAIREIAWHILEDTDTPTRTRMAWEEVKGHVNTTIAAVKGEGDEKAELV
jgi:hypothetical protein